MKQANIDFRGSPSRPGSKVACYVNAGFIVSGSTLRNLPKELWTNILLEQRSRRGSQLGDPATSTARQISVMMEYSYHIIFTAAASRNLEKKIIPNGHMEQYSKNFICGIFDCESGCCNKTLRKWAPWRHPKIEPS
eukprot:gnl/MRDRNA2_/MRDRNA2_69561_c0_seq1.p1 gnl/MRDRNA2_/MRDRNA2_69561_c0~~gnl/MRDRNA2_/MRDRNA2_69561_c0_seq1.p1  ORF type:complete len:136 (+),score=13.87 gnl/MRDRNA2_/MRDRNA2_69561_c0_seq1:82-489(+)